MEGRELPPYEDGWLIRMELPDCEATLGLGLVAELAGRGLKVGRLLPQGNAAKWNAKADPTSKVAVGDRVVRVVLGEPNGKSARVYELWHLPFQKALTTIRQALTQWREWNHHFVGSQVRLELLRHTSDSFFSFLNEKHRLTKFREGKSPYECKLSIDLGALTLRWRSSAQLDMEPKPRTKLTQIKSVTPGLLTLLLQRSVSIEHTDRCFTITLQDERELCFEAPTEEEARRWVNGISTLYFAAMMDEKSKNETGTTLGGNLSSSSGSSSSSSSNNGGSNEGEDGTSPEISLNQQDEQDSKEWQEQIDDEEEEPSGFGLSRAFKSLWVKPGTSTESSSSSSAAGPPTSSSLNGSSAPVTSSTTHSLTSTNTNPFASLSSPNSNTNNGNNTNSSGSGVIIQPVSTTETGGIKVVSLDIFKEVKGKSTNTPVAVYSRAGGSGGGAGASLTPTSLEMLLPSLGILKPNAEVEIIIADLPYTLAHLKLGITIVESKGGLFIQKIESGGAISEWLSTKSGDFRSPKDTKLSLAVGDRVLACDMMEGSDSLSSSSSNSSGGDEKRSFAFDGNTLGQLAFDIAMRMLKTHISWWKASPSSSLLLYFARA